MFHIQHEDGHYQAPKHVVVLFVIKNIVSIHQIVVLDSRYTPIYFNYKYNGDDEPYDNIQKTVKMFDWEAST